MKTLLNLGVLISGDWGENLVLIFIQITFGSEFNDFVQNYKVYGDSQTKKIFRVGALCKMCNVLGANLYLPFRKI